MKDSLLEYRACVYEEILPLKNKDAKYCGFVYKDKAKYFGAFLGDKIIGCCGYIVERRKIKFVNSVVCKEYRNNGIYSKLWDIRENAIKCIEHESVYSYCTKMSVHKLLKEGFTVKKMFKQGFLVERKK